MLAKLKIGDLIIFIEDAGDGLEPGATGLIIERCTDPDDDPAILLQFAGERPSDYVLHYYDRELLRYLKSGTIRIQHAS